MTYMSLILSEETAASCIRELGSLGCMQFIDLNSELTPFQRRYVGYIKRCDEIERKIRYVHCEVKKMNIPILPAGSVDSFIERALETEAIGIGGSALQSLETKLDLYERQLIELNKYNDKLTEEFTHKVEFNQLLKNARTFLHDIPSANSTGGDLNATPTRDYVTNKLRNKADYEAVSVNDESYTGSYYSTQELSFSHIAGVILTTEQNRFDRMLYRATRGNCYLRFKQMSNNVNDAQGKPILKTCFIVFYKSTAIEMKIKKICDAFGVNRYNLNNLYRPQELDSQLSENESEIVQATHILNKNNEARMRLCIELAQHVEEWLWVVKREKSTYQTLNLFKSDVAGNTVLRGRGWILTASIADARNAIKRAHSNVNLPQTALLERVSNEVWPTAPTHFETNKYTVAFQSFVNTYGVPRYKEINPALFTAATFPFLFGVMYGDIGHGTCLTCAGLYLILTESLAELRSTPGMLKDIYMARYMLFAMGLMAIYAGLIYNDYFSISLNLFGSKWYFKEEVTDEKASYISGSYGDASTVYPFGTDPVWKVSSNELLFYNSMKMKMSVILGIFQMTVGIVLRGINAVYFKNWTDLYCEFIPMILFDMALFGYMVVLIFVKWSINWDSRMALGTCSYSSSGVYNSCSLSTSTSCYTYDGSVCTSNTMVVDMCPLNFGGSGDGCQPPNLITTLINIALKPGNVDEPMFGGQAGLQIFLLLVAFICVPWLLFVKPFYLKYEHDKLLSTRRNSGSDNPLLGSHDTHDDHTNLILPTKSFDEHGHSSSSSNSHGHGEFDFGEVFIHQAIETIEFVLGMVSNTASYLRLWALSLAHSELAEVFWDKALLSMIQTGNPVLIFLGFGVFAAVTFAVLLCMDVLECFLHALRLHWVEFQNKFFKADGHAFVPFDFKLILNSAILE